MPGPLAKNRTKRAPAPNSPNRKVVARLAARHAEIPQSGHYTTGVKTSFFRKAGSQNRKK